MVRWSDRQFNYRYVTGGSIGPSEALSPNLIESEKKKSFFGHYVRMLTPLLGLQNSIAQSLSLPIHSPFSEDRPLSPYG